MKDSVVKNGWNQLFREEVYKDEVSEEMDAEFDSILNLRDKYHLDIDVVAEIESVLPDDFIFGDGNEILGDETEEEEEGINEIEKNLSTKQVDQIICHVNSLIDIVAQNDPDDFRSSTFLTGLATLSSPYRILQASRIAQKVQPRITAFLKPKTKIPLPAKCPAKMPLFNRTEAQCASSSLVAISQVQIAQASTNAQSGRELLAETPSAKDRHYTIEEIAVAFHSVWTCTIEMKNVQVEARFHQIWGQDFLHKAFSSVLRISNRVDHEKWAFIGKKVDESNSAAIYLVFENSLADSSQFKMLTNYFTERKSGAVFKFISFEKVLF